MPDEPEERKLPTVDDRQLELFKEWVSVQKEEISLKSKEASLREKEIAAEKRQVKLGHEYAHEALKAQSADRREERVFRRKRMLLSLWFGALLVILLAGSVVTLFGKVKLQWSKTCYCKYSALGA